MIFGLDTTTTILIALVPTTFTMVVGLMAYVIKRLGTLGEASIRNEERLKAIQEKLDDDRR